MLCLKPRTNCQPPAALMRPDGSKESALRIDML